MASRNRYHLRTRRDELDGTDASFQSVAFDHCVRCMRLALKWSIQNWVTLLAVSSLSRKTGYQRIYAFLQTVFNLHGLANAILDMLPLLFSQSLQGATRVSAIAKLHLYCCFGAGDSSLGQNPVALGENLLQLGSFFILALLAEIPDLRDVSHSLRMKL